jgi:holo-[acyl-carrier protein] synthase
MISVGTDITSIQRIKKLSINDRFLDKIYTFNEIEYCNKYSNPHVHFSGKYAAKEAVKKAILSGLIAKNISLKKIEILNKSDNSPYVVIHGLNSITCKLSISHDTDYAIAFALIV